MIDKERMKESSIEEIRALLGLNNRTKPPNWAGIVHFLVCCIPAAVLILLPIIILILWLP